MTSHTPAPTSSANEKGGALEELLDSERQISNLLAQADAEAERLLEAARAEIAERHASSLERLADELTAQESRLRAAVAEESRALVDATRRATERFDHASETEVAALADFVLLRLYDVAPTPTGRAT